MDDFLTLLSEIGALSLFSVVVFVLCVFLLGLISKFLDKQTCNHNWMKIEKVGKWDEGVNRHLYIFECKKCGSLKKVKIYG